MWVMKSCVWIVRCNFEFCFFEMSVVDCEVLLVKNFELLGMGLMEIGMVWFWLMYWVVCWIEISGVNEVVEFLEEKQGILLIGIYFLIFEMGV